MALNSQQHLHISSYSVVKESIAMALGKLHRLLQEGTICKAKFGLHQLGCLPCSTSLFWQGFVLPQKYKVQTRNIIC